MKTTFSHSFVYISILSTAFCSENSQKCPGTCDRKTAKKFYILGETGIGKSTMANVLSGQLPSTGCFEAKNSMTPVTKMTYDQGCFPLVDGSFNNEVIIVDTPGLRVDLM